LTIFPSLLMAREGFGAVRFGQLKNLIWTSLKVSPP
jgi:hypothetical protein